MQQLDSNWSKLVIFFDRCSLDLDLDYICEKLCRFYNFGNDFFDLCVFKFQNVQVIQIDANVAK